MLSSRNSRPILFVLVTMVAPEGLQIRFSVGFGFDFMRRIGD